MTDRELQKSMSKEHDPRIVYGAQCTWWGSIYEVSTQNKYKLPCCPHCGGMLCEVKNSRVWDDLVRKYEVTQPGYAEVLFWGRGKCFRSYKQLEDAFKINQKIMNQEKNTP
jgi:hypothetical protein